MAHFHGLLGAITVRIRVIAIGIVIIGGVGVYCVQHDSEQMTLDADEKVTRAGKGLLRSFSAAHHEQHSVGLNRKDHGIGGGHNRRRVNDDKFETFPQFSNRIRQVCLKREDPRDSAEAVLSEWRQDWGSTG